jgi:hypothetical protein
MNTQGSKLWIVVVIGAVLFCGCVFCAAAAYWLWTNGDRLLEGSPFFGMLLTFI